MQSISGMRASAVLSLVRLLLFEASVPYHELEQHFPICNTSQVATALVNCDQRWHKEVAVWPRDVVDSALG